MSEEQQQGAPDLDTMIRSALAGGLHPFEIAIGCRRRKFALTACVRIYERALEIRDVEGIKPKPFGRIARMLGLGKGESA
jgi:hypothetical protein